MEMTHPPGSTASAGSPRRGLASAERDHGVIARREKEQFNFPGELDCIKPHRSGRRLARSGGWTTASDIRVSQPFSTVNRRNPYSWFDWWRVVDGRHVQWLDSPRTCLVSRDEGLAHAPVVRTRFPSAPPQTAVGSGVPTECRSRVTPGIPAPLLAASVAGKGMSVSPHPRLPGWRRERRSPSASNRRATARRGQLSDPTPMPRLPGCASAI